jgi:histidinol-phosphate aminotransferase
MIKREKGKMIQPRKAIQKMKPYNPPTASRKGKLRVDFNENTVGPSPQVLALLKKLNEEDLVVYPEYGMLREKLAEYLGVAKNQVIATNGTDEAILTVMSSFIEKDDVVVLPVPTFAMFKFYASIFEAKIMDILYKNDLSFPTKAVLNAINKKTKLVVLVNPNNPTASSISDEDIKKILLKARENSALVLIDEAYYQFMGRSSIELISDYDNLIILQTFSKAFGLAGLRLGYVISNEEVVKTLSKVLSPYSVNSIAVTCGIMALDDVAYVDEYVKEVLKSKEILYREFEKLDIKTYKSDANFFVAYFGDKATAIYQKLKDRNILVRDRTTYPLLKDCLRIGVGTRKQTRFFLYEVKEVLAEVGWKQ